MLIVIYDGDRHTGHKFGIINPGENRFPDEQAQELVRVGLCRWPNENDKNKEIEYIAEGYEEDTQDKKKRRKSVKKDSGENKMLTPDYDNKSVEGLDES